MHTTGWSRGLEVTGGGQGVVSHAGLVLLRHLADKTGLTGGLSRALATPRFLVHDRGRVTADLACAIADGARVISDFRVMRDQRELFGLVASVPTAWRTLKEIARGGARADRRITAAVNTARRHAWVQVAARHGALPGVRLADRTLDGVTCIRLDATVTFAHSDKELAEANFKGYGHHPLLAVCDNTGGEPLAWMLRRGSAGSNTAADHLAITDAAIAAIPPRFRRKLMITCVIRGRGQSRPGQAPGHAGRPPRLRADVLGRVGAERAGEDGAAARTRAGLAGRDRRPRGDPRAPRRRRLRRCGLRAPGVLDRRSARHRADRAAAPQRGRGPAAGLARGDARLRAPRAAPSRRPADPVRGRGRLAVLPVGHEPARQHQRLARAGRLHRRRAPGPGPGRGRDPHREKLRNRPFPLL
jgi:hypothetical protein